MGLRMLLLGVLMCARVEQAFAADAASPLAEGYSMPEGYTSLRVGKQEKTGRPQIDAVYAAPTGEALRFTVVRADKKHSRPGRLPIDVCVRDDRSGAVLLPPQLSGDTPLIEGCSTAADAGGGIARSNSILDALSSLAKVRFTPEYRSEYIALLNQATVAAPPDQALLELGDGVIIHEQKPPLPPAPEAGK
jgi:hypothetical protein